MQLDITYEQADEEISIILDDTEVLKVVLGAKGELILNEAFKELEESNEYLYAALRKIVRELFELQDI